MIDPNLRMCYHYLHLHENLRDLSPIDRKVYMLIVLGAP